MSSKLGRISGMIREYAESVGCFNQTGKTDFEGDGRKIRLNEVVSSKFPIIIIVQDSLKGKVGLKEAILEKE